MSVQFLLAAVATALSIEMLLLTLWGVRADQLSANAAVVSSTAGIALTSYSVQLFFTLEPAMVLIGGSLVILSFVGLLVAGYIVMTVLQWFAAACRFVVFLVTPVGRALSSTIEFVLPRYRHHGRHVRV
ncbi:MAG TPA: hypothetical protein VLA88_04405 [Candidatus Saccharimonadales bacterium]|nr:hypothetical protein [Candidatus Saccharimonadales bacterium]